jgi:two-component system, OmpR family, response regulator
MQDHNARPTVPAHILVVDDEAPVSTLLRECFELEGFEVSVAKNGADVSDILARCCPDLITLDLNLGGENGLDLARQIRSQHNIPVIMITGKGDTIDRVVGLELGADDYIAKPFHLREVLARVRAVLRRYDAPVSTSNDRNVSQPTGERLAFDDWVLDITKRELTTPAGTVCPLTTAEFNLLELLATRPSRVLSRDNIMDLLKGHEWSPLDRSIDSLVVRVRKKIEACPDTPRLIKTVRGVGYVFASDVRKV